MSQKRYWLPIVMFMIVSAFYLYEFLLRVLPSALFSDFMAAYQIDAANFGLLSSAYFLSYGLLQLPIGAWIDRYGVRRLLTMAILLCGLATLLSAYTAVFFWACVARFLIGAGSAFAFICCMKIISNWFSPKYFSMLTGLTLMIGTLGAVAGQVPVSYLRSHLSWQSILYGLGLLGIGLAILSWSLIRDKASPNTVKEPVNFKQCLKSIVQNKQNLWIACYGLLVTGPTDTLGGSWGIAFLQQGHGFSRPVAASCCSMVFVGLALGSLFFGWLTDAWGSRKKPMLLSSVLATGLLSAMIYLPSYPVSVAFVLFFAYGFNAIYVLSFIAAKDINSNTYVGTAVGLVNTASILGSALLIFSVGILLDWSIHYTSSTLYTIEDYRLALSVLPLCYLLSAVVVIPRIKDKLSLT